MAISSYKVFLMKGATGGASYEKLVDIKNFPNLGGTPEQLDTTTLSDKARTYINGIQAQDAMTFQHNYTLEDYQKLKALEDIDTPYAVWFGGTERDDGTVAPTGEHGKFKFNGKLSVYVDGADVNQVVNMTSSIAPSTPVTLDAAV